MFLTSYLDPVSILQYWSMFPKCGLGVLPPKLFNLKISKKSTELVIIGCWALSRESTKKSKQGFVNFQGLACAVLGWPTLRFCDAERKEFGIQFKTPSASTTIHLSKL